MIRSTKHTSALEPPAAGMAHGLPPGAPARARGDGPPDGGRRRHGPPERSQRRYDVYARFARRHLRTREERAVYLTLVSQQAESWSAAEIAELKQLDARDIQRILRAYEVSGIVEAAGPAKDRRYRWRSDMNYLFGGVNDSPEWADPVCGMPVTDDSPYRADDLFRRPRRFCSSLCLAAFRAFPGTFSGPPPAGAGETA